MPKITKGHNSRSIFQNFFKSKSGCLLLTTSLFISFKALAPTVFEIFCWQGKNAPNYKRVITQKEFFKISSKVNQVVYSSLPVYSSSFKALAPTVFEIFCWQGKNAPNYKRAITHEVFFRISSKINQVIYSSLQIHLLSFKALALTVFEIFCWQGKNA